MTNAEWQEIVALDYVLTWRYTDDYELDLKRYKELTQKQRTNSKQRMMSINWKKIKEKRNERKQMEIDLGVKRTHDEMSVEDVKKLYADQELDFGNTVVCEWEEDGVLINSYAENIGEVRYKKIVERLRDEDSGEFFFIQRNEILKYYDPNK